MSSERLREAAALLRERATAATPGPWHVCERVEDHFDVFGADTVVCGPMHEPIGNLSDEWYEPDPGEPTAAVDATFIATMSPPVAFALADLLDEWIRDHALERGHIGDAELALVAAILGTTP